MINVIAYSILGEQGVATQPVVDALQRRADYRLAIEMWTSAPAERSARWFLAVCEALQTFIDAVFALPLGDEKERLMQEAADEMTMIVKLRPFAGRVGRA